MGVIINLCLKFDDGLTGVESKRETINYIALFYVNVITYPRPNPNADWANLC